MTAAGSPLLTTHHLAWSPGGIPVLGPVDLTIEPGQLVAIIGPNGAGKTSLLRLLAGILEPTSGQVRWRGELLGRQPRRIVAQKIVHLPQRRPLGIQLTVRRFVLLGRFPYQGALQVGPQASDLAVVDSALQRMGISHLEHRSLAELSGGEQQMVALAAALAQGGDLWLLDEPTTHLDPRHQLAIARLLGELHGAGRTLALATHDLNLAARLATRVIALAEGRVVADGPPTELFDPDLLESLFQARFEIDRYRAHPRVWLPL